MFTNAQMFTGFQRRSRATNGVSWFVMAPGIFLTTIAVAIVIWPELLAYMVASALLFVGVSLMLWAWSLRRVEQRTPQDAQVQYKVY